MPFYVNPCSALYQWSDEQLIFNRKILICLLLSQFMIAIILRIFSAFKNWDIEQIKKKIQQKNIQETQIIMQTLQNISILQNNNKSKNFNDNDQISKNNINILQNTIKLQINKYEFDDRKNKNFINFFKLKMSKSKFLDLFIFILGHYFIVGVAIIGHVPYSSSIVLMSLHVFFFLLLTLIHLCYEQSKENKIKKDQQGNVEKKQNKITQEQANYQQSRMNLKKTINKVEQNLNKKFQQNYSQSSLENPSLEGQNQQNNSIFTKISRLILILMSTINISLLFYVLISMKESYFDLKANKCA